MMRTTWGVVCALAVAGGALQGRCAHAEVTGGFVDPAPQGQNGQFELLDPAPPTVGPDTFESPNLIAFDEQQDVDVTSDLIVSPNFTIPAGSTISSHYVAFDPATPSVLTGFVDFDEPIVAVVRNPQGLTATAAAFGLPGVNYSVAPAIGPDDGTNDVMAVSASMPNRLVVAAAALSPGDQVRVLTGTIVPEPHTAALLIAAAMVLSPRLRRGIA